MDSDGEGVLVNAHTKTAFEDLVEIELSSACGDGSRARRRGARPSALPHLRPIL